MGKMKRQVFKVGAIVKILIAENKLVFGRIFPGYHIGIYENVFETESELPTIDDIRLYRALIDKG